MLFQDFDILLTIHAIDISFLVMCQFIVIQEAIRVPNFQTFAGLSIRYPIALPLQRMMHHEDMEQQHGKGKEISLCAILHKVSN